MISFCVQIARADALDVLSWAERDMTESEFEECAYNPFDVFDAAFQDAFGESIFFVSITNAKLLSEFFDEWGQFYLHYLDNKDTYDDHLYSMYFTSYKKGSYEIWMAIKKI